MIKTTSARVAITVATAHGRETVRSKGGSDGGNVPAILHGLDCGRVLAAIERCEPWVQDWLIAAYAAEGYPGAGQARVCCQATLYAAYTRQRRVRSCATKMLDLAGATMQDFARRVQGAEPASVTWYAQRVGFRHQNWPVWDKARRVMEGILDEWDAAGLGEVALELPSAAA